jgi:hypothetical protein
VIDDATFFDDTGQPVPVCWPSEAELPPGARLSLAFEDAGCKDPLKLLEVIRPTLDEIADAHAMDFMRREIRASILKRATRNARRIVADLSRRFWA